LNPGPGGEGGEGRGGAPPLSAPPFRVRSGCDAITRCALETIGGQNIKIRIERYQAAPRGGWGSNPRPSDNGTYALPAALSPLPIIGPPQQLPARVAKATWGRQANARNYHPWLSGPLPYPLRASEYFPRFGKLKAILRAAAATRSRQAASTGNSYSPPRLVSRAQSPQPRRRGLELHGGRFPLP
jgi:hypothetical protein